MNQFTILVISCFTTLTVHAQSNQSVVQKNTKIEESTKVFIAYELGEAVFNKFQSLSGEVGIRFRNNQMLRISHVNLSLTEQHLSSGFAGAVDGDNIKGKQFGFELLYDFPILFKDFHIGPSVGYYKREFQHTLLDESLEKSSLSVGGSLSYRETNIFKIKGLYYSFTLPIRINLNPIQETILGTSVITKNTFDNNIWLFIGYEF